MKSVGRLRFGRFVCVCIFMFVSANPGFAQNFSFSGYSFDDSDYLTTNELQTIVRPFVNKSITFEDVQGLVSQVQAQYAERGIVTAKVLIEPQEVAVGGVLHLSLIEARLEGVSFDITSKIKARLVRKKLPLAVGEKPDYDALAKTAQFFEVAQGARYVVNFEPGNAPETTQATVALKAASETNWSVSADNQAAPNLGGESTAIGVSSFDRFDSLERFSGTLSLNQGGQTLSSNVSFPISPAVRATIGAEVSRGKVVAGPTRVLDVQSKRQELQLKLSGPFAIKADRHRTWALKLNSEKSSSTILGIPLSSVKLNEVSAGIGSFRNWPKAALQSNVGLSIGRADSGGASNTDGTYKMLNASLSYARRLGDRFALELSANGQLAPKQNLPGLRQISLGGGGSVVGYPHFVRSGDSGFHARAKVSCPAPCFGAGTGEIKISPFAFWDIGHVTEFRALGTPAADKDILTSLGIGLNFQVERVALTTQVGVPLKSTTGFDKDGEYAAYVALAFSF